MDSTMMELHKKMGTCFSESMASVFSMLTGREFTITHQEGSELDAAAIAALSAAPIMFVKSRYTKGLNGDMAFLLPLREGTMLVDLMLGGEGAPSEELANDSRDALAETFNQILGSANQTLSDLAGETFSIANVETFSLTAPTEAAITELLGPHTFQDIPLATAQDTLSTVVHLIFSNALAHQMSRKLGVGDSGAISMGSPNAEDAPAPATAPPPTPRMAAAAGPASPTYSRDGSNLDLLLDIELPLMVRMGQTEIQLGELLKLTPGAIIELNRAADAPVELLVNGKQIARGEVVVVDGNFAFRIIEIESTANRLRSLA